MKRTIYLILLFSALWSRSQSQSAPTSFRFWQLMRYNGRLDMNGTYRQTSFTSDGNTYTSSERYLAGILQLNTRSYFIHPNFMILDLRGTYNPETSTRHVGAPDMSETSKSQGIEGLAQFLRKKNYNLTVQMNALTTVQNVENISNYRSKNRNSSAYFVHSNKILNYTLTYSHSRGEQTILGESRNFRFTEDHFQATADKSFGEHDHHSFNFIQNANNTTQENAGNIVGQSGSGTMRSWFLTDQVSFGKLYQHSYTSGLNMSTGTGITPVRNLGLSQGLTFTLPWHFVLSNTFNYGETKRDTVRNDYQLFSSHLSHRLFQSLTSNANYTYTKTGQSVFDETRNKGGFDFLYSKKIPTGNLFLTYGYSREQTDATSTPVHVHIIREAYQLNDGQITLLNSQFPVLTTVQLEDSSGTIHYIENVDYLLIDKYPFAEIQRIPGGMIPNHGTVYAYYDAVKGGSYSYVMSNSYYSASATLFHSLLNAYYRYFKYDYSDISINENVALNFRVQQTAGVTVTYKDFRGGAEYEHNRSSLLPYSGMRYFAYYQHTMQRLSVGASANIYDQQMTNEDHRRLSEDIGGKAAYAIVRNLRMDLDYLYRRISESSLTIQVHSTKVTFTTAVRKFYLQFATEYYIGLNQSSNTRFLRTTVRITRYFN